MMQHEGHVRILKSLKLFGMAHAIEELGNQNSPLIKPCPCWTA